MLHRITDATAFEDAIEEIGKYIQAPQYELIIPEKMGTIKQLGAAATGHCIRCSDPIARNANRPLCGLCYDKTSPLAARHYMEKYCHHCGSRTATSLGIRYAQLALDSKLTTAFKLVDEPSIIVYSSNVLETKLSGAWEC